MSTFPDFLWIQLRKFTLAEDWTPVKIDVAIDVPHTLDLSWMKGNGPQIGEVLMSKEASSKICIFYLYILHHIYAYFSI